MQKHVDPLSKSMVRSDQVKGMSPATDNRNPRKKYNEKELTQARWGERVRHPEVMKCVTPESVIERLQQLDSANS